MSAGVVPLGSEVRERLRARLRRRIDAEDLGGLLLLRRSSVIWASGFDHSPSERPVGLYLPPEGTPVLFVPLLELEHAREVDGVEVEAYEEFPGRTHPVPWMAERIDARSGDGPLGIDELEARVHAALVDAGVDVALSDAAETERAVKEPEELALVRAAAGYADRVLAWILERGAEVIAAGGSELDLLRGAVGAATSALTRDHEGAFPETQRRIVGTVHSGPRAALPHGRTGPRRPRPGDVVIAGIGAMLGGYHAESGATFSVGEPSAEQARCLAAADGCGRTAAGALRVGSSCAAVNDAAWAALQEVGLGEHIRHRIGHGMGVDGHEAPWLAPGDATPLAPGMVFSNEPGIYRPGIDGYRTIDTMIVTDGAPEIPSRFQTTTPWDRRVIPSA